VGSTQHVRLERIWHLHPHESFPRNDLDHIIVLDAHDGVFGGERGEDSINIRLLHRPD
jgi:hypothetical protein